MATDLEPLLGDRYRMGRQIGRGGMGAVYEAVDERLGRNVAVKMLHGHLLDRDDLRERFISEARTAARLHHPNVVAIYDTGDHDGQPYLVMECLPGTTMGQRMAEGPVDLPWFTAVAADVLAAVDAAHSAGVVHRDLKPANILLAADGRAKVADFGIAKVLESADGSRDTTMVVGTPAYLAPEQAHGGRITPRTDVYALGVLFYEALAGERPGPTPVPLEQLRPDVPAAVAAAIHQAMILDPARRFATAGVFAEALGVAHTPVGVDPTMVLAPATATATATATTMAAPGATRSAPTRVGARPRRSVQSSRPPRWLTPALLVAAAVTAVALAAAVWSTFGGGGEERGSPAPELAAEMRALVPRLGPEDGPKAVTAGERLAEVADAVEEGTGADGASSLLEDVRGWRAERQLGPTATDKLVALLLRVPGVRDGATTTTVPAPTTATTAAPLVRVDLDGGDEPKGKGKGRGRDD